MNDASAQIPRILHRVWLGPRPPDDTYLASWRTHCPGWEIKTWRDADLADVELPYVRQALAAGKWAFASDYLRLVALYREGGIYLDTDVELTDSPERVRGCAFAVGITHHPHPQTAVICARPGHPIVKEVLDSYRGCTFDRGYGVYDEMPITTRLIRVLARHGVDFKALDPEKAYTPEPGVRLYPRSLVSRRQEGRPNIFTHHAVATWHDPYRRTAVTRLFGRWRLIKFKRRKAASAGAEPKLLADERALARFGCRRFLWVLARETPRK
ncbi:MAG: hypothetical protein IJI73_08440 [Kiritimatiellae bacterium]|nr:hypothetical protein [Kiritimatiellia bacterium]